MRGVVAVFSLGFLALAAGLPYDDDVRDYDYENDNKEIENDADYNSIKDYPTPTFTTESSNMIINEGDTVRLPCIVDRLEGFVMLWKRGEKIVTVASQIIDQGVRLEELNNGNYLILSQVTPEDAGRYTCQISAFKPTEIHHDLVVRTRPEVEVGQEEVTVVEGQPLSLECSLVSGSPQPQLSLVGPDGVDLSPHLTVQEDRLDLEVKEATRQMTGQYSCSADNGFGSSPSSREVTVTVEYPPELQISEAFILTDLAEKQEIHCTVDSQPPVLEVDWALNGQSITRDTPELEISSTGNQFTLTIPEVRLNSTGEYTCTAANPLGSSSVSALVSGEARPVVILSDAEGEEEESYHLLWSVASRSEVNSSVVSVRQQGEQIWTKHEVEVSANETVSETVGEDGTEYSGELELTGLSPGTSYEVTVATRNSFGLVDHGNIFTFTTKQSEELQESARQAGDDGDDGPDSEKVLTTGLAPDLRPLITPLLLSVLAALIL